MPTLKETKGRIASVRSTLKITSAMKLVASAKLRGAQRAIESMRPYEEELQRILAAASASTPAVAAAPSANEGTVAHGHSVIVAISSNSSLCGSFNANVISKVKTVRKKGDVVYSIGRKMADAMRREGFRSPQDLNALSEHPAYAPCAELVSKLMEDFNAGKVGKVMLVYNHFVSTSHQEPVVEQLLPVSHSERSEESVMQGPDQESPDIILEPSPSELLSALEPKVLKLKLYAALLDSSAAEHAARTVAMQTATDNGEKLLDELTLQYNKGRQQKITNEILDLAGGQTKD